MHCQLQTAVHRHCDLSALWVNQRLHLVTGYSYIMITIIRPRRPNSRHEDIKGKLILNLSTRQDDCELHAPATHPRRRNPLIERPDCTYTQINTTCWLQSLSIMTLTCGSNCQSSDTASSDYRWHEAIKFGRINCAYLDTKRKELRSRRVEELL